LLRVCWSKIAIPVLPLANNTAGMTRHEWKCVFEDRTLLFLRKGIHLYDAVTLPVVFVPVTLLKRDKCDVNYC